MIFFIGLCFSATLKDVLVGEWRVARVEKPNDSVFTIEFHNAGESKLISTLWRDDVPMSKRFSLSETPLVAKMEIRFAQATSGKIFSDGKELCNFDMSTGRMSAKIGDMTISVEQNSNNFYVTVDQEKFIMTRAPVFASEESTHESSDNTKFYDATILERFGLEKYSTIIYLILAVISLQVVFSVVGSICRCLCCPKKTKKGKKKGDKKTGEKKKKRAKKVAKKDGEEINKPAEEEKEAPEAPVEEGKDGEKRKQE